MWKDYELTVNSLPQTARFNEDTVNNLFLPLIERLTKLHREKNGRVIAFMVAPPATGKSTLTLFWEQLARKRDIFLQAVGLDGFHYPNDYLEAHFTERDGKQIPLIAVKGSPDTFDADGLRKKLTELKATDTVSWPIYSRKLHNPVPDGQKVTGEIILLEGNWLLLNDARWRDIRQFADYTLSIKADAEILKERLISRKVQGGISRDEATAFYEQSDRLNVERVLQSSAEADETWQMKKDGDFYRL